MLQRYKDKKERKEEEAKLAVLASSPDVGQPVLGMTFCVKRRKEISRLAGKSVLSDLYCDLRTEPLLKKSQRDVLTAVEITRTIAFQQTS